MKNPALAATLRATIASCEAALTQLQEPEGREPWCPVCFVALTREGMSSGRRCPRCRRAWRDGDPVTADHALTEPTQLPRTPRVVQFDYAMPGPGTLPWHKYSYRRAIDHRWAPAAAGCVSCYERRRVCGACCLCSGCHPLTITMSKTLASPGPPECPACHLPVREMDYGNRLFCDPCDMYWTTRDLREANGVLSLLTAMRPIPEANRRPR